MNASETLSLVSVAIAISAVIVASWQVRATARSAERAHALPVVSEISSEFRSPKFRSSIHYLISQVPTSRGSHGFSSLSTEWRDHAYHVCYFFDYMGALVSFRIIREELAISLWGTAIIQVWQAAEPYIYLERAHRRKTYPPGISPGFLVYYEDLVCRIRDRGGHDAARRIQERSGLRRLERPLNEA
jgi:hypothetical protein